MTITNIAVTAIEIIVAALLIAGLFNEDKLADLEEKLFAAIKRRFRKSRKAAARRHREMTAMHSTRKASY